MATVSLKKVVTKTITLTLSETEARSVADGLDIVADGYNFGYGETEVLRSIRDLLYGATGE